MMAGVCGLWSQQWQAGRSWQKPGPIVARMRRVEKSLESGRDKNKEKK
jgi:hypothetical protein